MGHWWKKRVSLALGVATMGSAVGGVIMPIAARNLIKDIGYSKILLLLRHLLIDVFGK
jgi:MFS transporter, MCT family, solute carrier family 16 (monocarboxylic acid transporters), member 10